MNPGPCIWVGASGVQYTYYISGLLPNFDPNQNGNYIYCKKVNNLWSPIYIGQGICATEPKIIPKWNALLVKVQRMFMPTGTSAKQTGNVRKRTSWQTTHRLTRRPDAMKRPEVNLR